MNTLEIIAFVIAGTVCLLPGIMAWNHYFGGARKTSEEKPVLRHTSVKPAIGKAF